MIWLVVGTLVPSMMIAWLAGFAVRRFGPRFGLVDRPGHRKVHAAPTPTSGGLAIWLGVVLPLALGHLALAVLVATRDEATGQALVALPEFVTPHLAGLVRQSGRMWTILAGGTVLVALGLADDRRGLDWRLRLGVQTVVATAMVVLGFRLTIFMDWPVLTGALSVLWIVGLVNSFNMLDNMDGLSAGVGAIAASLLAAVALLAPSPVTGQPQLFIGGFLLVLVGSLVGFLWHNRPPARLFMGDAGAYLIGYLLAVVTLTATFAGYEAPHRILAPLCVLAVPLYDTTTVVFIRLREGRSPFVGDKSHFSHRLVELGMTKPQAVWTIYLTTATCGLGALVLHQVDIIGAAIVVLVVVCTLVLVGILETTGRRGRNNGSGGNGGHGAA
ncbi:MAG: undecaprenyl/decaprenyl-phosphate alpha-N-acetylglucosaminyl 1-phosphate transferase [Thermoguttaceae bacterium]|nr:undecaprenyl/decaprenyl-phosphate alpha-N-acetylglucosaminyl 1-phosphate transferase [Thermoguttaceae bacterium]